MKMPPPHPDIFEYLVPSCWNFLKGLEGVALLEEACHRAWGQALRFQKSSCSLPGACGSGEEL